MFGPVINENMQNPVAHGVDISREERCSNALYNTSDFVVLDTRNVKIVIHI